MRGEYIGPTRSAYRGRRARPPRPAQKPWAVRGAQREEHHDERRQRHHARLAADDRRDDRLLLILGQLPHSLGVLETALVENRLGRGDAQLLGDERHREGKQRVQIEEVIG